MSDTAGRIIDSMQRLIQTRGYSAVSFQDIAADLGIRKASIHYHFPGKLALGIAVVERYRKTIASALAEARARGLTGWKLLKVYLGPFVEFGETEDKICLCGALAGEFLALPLELQDAVSEFFEEHQNWLESVLQEGRRNGEFEFSGSARQQARTLFSTLQGALLVKRTNGDARQVSDVVAELRARLKTVTGKR